MSGVHPHIGHQIGAELSILNALSPVTIEQTPAAKALEQLRDLLFNPEAHCGPINKRESVQHFQSKLQEIEAQLVKIFADGDRENLSQSLVRPEFYNLMEGATIYLFLGEDRHAFAVELLRSELFPSRVLRSTRVVNAIINGFNKRVELLLDDHLHLAYKEFERHLIPAGASQVEVNSRARGSRLLRYFNSREYRTALVVGAMNTIGFEPSSESLNTVYRFIAKFGPKGWVIEKGSKEHLAGFLKALRPTLVEYCARHYFDHSSEWEDKVRAFFKVDSILKRAEVVQAVRERFRKLVAELDNGDLSSGDKRSANQIIRQIEDFARRYSPTLLAEIRRGKAYLAQAYPRSSQGKS